ncbi:MAG: ornithine cyclodeaminase family protein [Lewinellaceae bacterium]|nr:ornithine cyclodeaminase family protein [Phaeodactylibacter sp.]MCB9038038.1 ornithine cyclodeaminase family protein [Lewinellaceae bacterium]
MPYLTADQLEALLPFPQLIEALRQAFAGQYTVPLRHHHDYKIPGEAEPGALLLMPAWDEGRYFGVKLVAVSPHNRRRGLPTIQGLYTLFETATGAPILQMDAKALTNLRTAAASALASTFLSRPDSHILLMAGTGALAPYLIKAHASVRPIKKVIIWGRNPEKAEALAVKLQNAQQFGTPILQYSSVSAQQLPSAVSRADIISCATLSPNPLVPGQWLQPGQHIDLVGSFRPNMREADDEAIRRSIVYVDTMEGALKETGDIVQPIQNKTLRPEDIPGDLFSLCRTEAPGRQSPEAITLFKSVGLALEDLAAAKLAWEKQGKR